MILKALTVPWWTPYLVAAVCTLQAASRGLRAYRDHLRAKLNR